MNPRCPPKRVPSAALFYTLCRLTVLPPQSYSIGGQHSSGQLTGKPAGARPDYRGCWCATALNGLYFAIGTFLVPQRFPRPVEGSPVQTLRERREELLLSRIPCAAMDSVEMESVQIKEEFSEPELVPFRVEISGLASLPIKQELCEMQCDSSQLQVSEIKAEQSELEIPQTEEPLPVKQEEVLESVRIKQEPPDVEFEHMEPGKEESEDFKPNIPELEPVRQRECSVVRERICVRERGAGEEDRWSHSECSLAGE
ncbi:UNVERIFIED_CONTAM: hypothetical protein FKN15_021786 [Acipenser sinensis]